MLEAACTPSRVATGQWDAWIGLLWILLPKNHGKSIYCSCEYTWPSLVNPSSVEMMSKDCTGQSGDELECNSICHLWKIAFLLPGNHALQFFAQTNTSSSLILLLCYRAQTIAVALAYVCGTLYFQGNVFPCNAEQYSACLRQRPHTVNIVPIRWNNESDGRSCRTAPRKVDVASAPTHGYCLCTTSHPPL